MSSVGQQNEINRHAWVKEIIRAIPGGHRLLDAGAGEGRYKQNCHHLVYVSQDFGMYDGRGDRRGLQMGTWEQKDVDIICDITDIPEPDRSFDAVLCTEVLEHIPDPLKALGEFGRLLRHGGLLILTAPFCSLTHFAPFHYYTGFNRYFFETHLPDKGFEILEIKENGNFFEYLAQEIRRIPDVAQRYSRKKVSFIDKNIMKAMLFLLQNLSGEDSGSNEILHFGCFVLARKV